jgi:hypothetical protein
VGFDSWWTAIGAILLLGSPALAAPPTLSERFPAAAGFETLETSVGPDGVSTTTRSRTTCTRKGVVERCVIEAVSGKPFKQSSESTLDERGIWSVGMADDGEMKLTFEPPVLTFPVDARPGSKWRAEFDETFSTPDAPPFKRRSIRESVAVTTERCPRGRAGLLVKTTKMTDGALRMKSESLFCEGLPAPYAVDVELFRDGKRTHSISSRPTPP